MFWLGLAAGVFVPLGLVPLCATVLLRRWLANEGFEDPDDDDDDEFDWRAPSDHRGGQHATPAPVPELQPGEIVALADDVGEVSDRLYVVAACKGAITAVDPVDGGPRQFAKTGNVRRLGEQHASPVHGFGDCVPGLPRRTDAELDALADTIRRNG